MAEDWKTTGEVATICGVKPYTIRKWIMRGDLPLAPRGRSGQGRGNESLWSPEAFEQVMIRASEHRSTGFRKVNLERPKP